jgi:lipid II:glycine glycyltransferase (peptidoglycan interpeptide bridge formation enzyme)
MQYHAMQVARDQYHCHTYDLLGVDPPWVADGPLAGVTTFKQKLGGQYAMHPPAYGVVLAPRLYWLWHLVKWGKGWMKK